ncbi:ABC transporter ATP-binding protein [Helcococcus ovis]|uniref:ABC transporter ATP-binding protein n=1 Tax=Helcococcus ovis TaxID=72026 RepID=UPI0038BB3EF2
MNEKKDKIIVQNLSFSYENDLIIDNVNFSIKEGQITTFLGGNGCGKSTLFYLMTKELIPNSGKIFLENKNISDISIKNFAKNVSIVQQLNDVKTSISVENLVSLGRTPHKKLFNINSDEDEKIIDWALRVTSIEKYRKCKLSNLSGGQRQRAWIAMALAQETKVLFLDEPTTFLDIRYQIEILDLIKKINKEFNITIIMVLHDINQAIRYSDKIIGLKKGKIEMEGGPSEVITEENIKKIYGINLKIKEIEGQKYILNI